MNSALRTFAPFICVARYSFFVCAFGLAGYWFDMTGSLHFDGDLKFVIISIEFKRRSVIIAQPFGMRLIELISALEYAFKRANYTFLKFRSLAADILIRVLRVLAQGLIPIKIEYWFAGSTTVRENNRAREKNREHDDEYEQNDDNTAHIYLRAHIYTQ